MTWEVTLKVLKHKDGLKYKVTRRLPEYYTSETKIFNNKEEALKQFHEWLE
jgi:hypothetical protein